MWKKYNLFKENKLVIWFIWYICVLILWICCVIENILWNLIVFIYVYNLLYEIFKIFSEYLCGFLFGVGFCK